MVPNYKTPGVYVEEIALFPPSVAQVETAIPAFIGYTDKAIVGEEDVLNKPIKVRSMKEYETYFGGAPNPTSIIIDLNADDTVKTVKVSGEYLMYDTLRMFYSNGGGDCYIVSVGAYQATPTYDKDLLLNGLDTIAKEDAPTILVIPEAIHFTEVVAGEIHAAMLAQCNKLQDRFAILDIVNGNLERKSTLDPVANFRNVVGNNNLKYGAAYYPWLKTTLSYKNDYDVIIGGTYTKSGSPVSPITSLFNTGEVLKINNINEDIVLVKAISIPSMVDVTTKALLETNASSINDLFTAFNNLSFKDNDTSDSNSVGSLFENFTADNMSFSNNYQTFLDYIHYSNEGGTPWATRLLPTLTFPAGYTADPANDIYTATNAAINAAPYFNIVCEKLIQQISLFIDEMSAILDNHKLNLLQIDTVYQGIYKAIKGQGIVLPPSGAIAGVYASVDNSRGVWKAPANVSINAVVGPAVLINHHDQEDLNIHPTSGKSINAIRAFTGKGCMVWGARTLAGNDAEWKYVSVRRFFNMVEESVKKATSTFVFEPNDANTWVKTRAMIENFLTLQWRAGALAGAKADDAFYVNVGLGTTMTAQDILDGKMIIEIGMAAVRPAEFIILRFSHKMQES